MKHSLLQNSRNAWSAGAANDLDMLVWRLSRSAWNFFEYMGWWRGRHAAGGDWSRPSCLLRGQVHLRQRIEKGAADQVRNHDRECEHGYIVQSLRGRVQNFRPAWAKYHETTSTQKKRGQCPNPRCSDKTNLAVAAAAMLEAEDQGVEARRQTMPVQPSKWWE
jgi:hypothetical protein